MGLGRRRPAALACAPSVFPRSRLQRLLRWLRKPSLRRHRYLGERVAQDCRVGNIDPARITAPVGGSMFLLEEPTGA